MITRRFVQPEKDLFPMLVRLAGIVTLVNVVEFEKAESGILVTPSGITRSVISNPFLSKTCNIASSFGYEIAEYSPKVIFNQASTFVIYIFFKFTQPKNEQ